MSSLKYFFPANRLTEALNKAPLRSVKQCLAQADENLRHIGEACAEHVDRNLAMLEAEVARWPKARDDAYLDTIYQLSLRIIGVATVAGLHDLDRAATSLCDVVDGMAVRQAWDVEAIAVHVASMRLLRKPQSLGSGAGAVIDGLLRVRSRFVAPKPAQVRGPQAPSA